MLVEPPGPHLPARFGLTGTRVELLRGGAAVAALVLALTSRGDAVVLAGLLVVTAWRPLAAVAVVPALAASSWRWGSTSLDALAGAQAVLGPAGWVGPATATATAWLAAAALVLSAPAGRTRLVDGLAQGAVGLTAAAVVVGPSAAGDWGVRLAGALAGLAIAAGAGRLRAALTGSRAAAHGVAEPASPRPARGRVLDGVAAGAGLGALALAGPEAPAWSGTLDGHAARTGTVVALAAGAVAVVGMRALAAMSLRRP